MRELENRPDPRVRALIVMFCAGFFSIIAQVLALRELLVIFSGNELTIGAILGFWLIGVGLGSLVASLAPARLTDGRLKLLMISLLCALAALLPLQITAIRHIRSMLGGQFGEDISLSGMLVGTGCVLIPICMMIGAIFPCVCQLTAMRYRHAINRVYAADALGSMAGGVLFSFLLAPFIPSMSTAGIAGAFALAGAAMLAVKRPTRCLLAALAVCATFAGLYPPFTAPAERAGVLARWRSFGYISPSGKEGPHRILDSTDSRYQNLVLIEAEGQKTLYGNGRVMFIFPDTAGAEHRIHFIMAQKPDARSVLLIGGCPAADIPQLLKYPLSRLVHVELDEKIRTILRKQADPDYLSAIADLRLEEKTADGPRFVKTCRERFDVIIIMAPLPATMALNRYYTSEFFRDASRILAPGGFLHTSIEASAHLAEESAGLAASVNKALSGVFARVFFTAGERIQFFAGMKDSPLTLDRETLFQRSAAANIRNEYFRPLYFLDCEELNSLKLDFVEEKLAGADVNENTLARPISTFYSLMLWSRFSGSRLERFFAALRKVRPDITCGFLALAGFTSLAAAGLLRALSRRTPSVSGRLNRGWFRCMMSIGVGSAGCCEMALQIILIFIFQSVFGYVYERIGMITAVYMMGLTLGAISATWMARGERAWPCIFALELIILSIAAGIPAVMTLGGREAIAIQPPALTESLFYLLFVLTGWAGGAHFSLANHLLTHHTGGSAGSIASITNAADLLGSAIGGFAVGVLLLPLLGISAASTMLVAVKAGGALCVASALVVGARQARLSAAAENDAPIS